MTEERIIRYPSSAGNSITPEYEWEGWFGDAGIRASNVGRGGLKLRRYFADELEKRREEVKSAYDAKRSAHDIRKDEDREEQKLRLIRGENVAQLGRKALQLRGIIHPLPKSYAKALMRKYEKEPLELVVENNETKPKEDEDLSSDDEDWDTTEWNKEETEGAVDMLVQEIRSSPQLKRRKVATKMLTRLLTKHKSAVEHLDLIIPSLADKALFYSQNVSTRSAEASRLSHLLAAAARFIPEKLSRFACCKKATRLITGKYQMAAKLIQAKWRIFTFEKKQAVFLCLEKRFRRRHVLLLGYNDLITCWRNHEHQETPLLNQHEYLSQLYLLNSLCGELNPSFMVKDRQIFVEQGGLYPAMILSVHKIQSVRYSAVRLLHLVAGEPTVRLEMLESGVHVTLSVLLQSELVEDRCMALEVLDKLVEVVSHAKQNILRETWKRIHDDNQEQHTDDNKNNFKMFSSYMRKLNPVERTIDSVLLLIDRRRDGGLLRYLKYLLQSQDGLVRLGAGLCLVKLASSSCNPYLLCVGEKKTIHEIREETKKLNPSFRKLKLMEVQDGDEQQGKLPYDKNAGYEERRVWRQRQFTYSVVNGIFEEETNVPGLSITCLQLLFQLSACAKSRKVLMETSTPEAVITKILANSQDEIDEKKKELLIIKGLLSLIALAGNSDSPISLNTQDTTREVDSSQKQYLSIIDMDIFATQEQLKFALQSSLLAMVSQSNPKHTQSSVERFCFEFNGLPLLYDFLFPPTTTTKQDEEKYEADNNNEDDDQDETSVAKIEQFCVTGLTIAKFIKYCPRIGGPLCSERVILGLTKVIKVAFDLCETSSPSSQGPDEETKREGNEERKSYLDDLPSSIKRLVKTSTQASCNALLGIARSKDSAQARWTVASFLLQHGILRYLSRIISFSSKQKGLDTLDVEMGIASANLLGGLLPWRGISGELCTDLCDDGLLNAQEDDDKIDYIVNKKKLSLERMRKRAARNAKNAADKGVVGLNFPILKSRFPNRGSSKLCRSVISICSKRLIKSLSRTNCAELQYSISYALSRMCSTASTARLLAKEGCFQAIDGIFKSISKSLEAKGGKKKNRGLYAEKLCQLPVTIITLCATLARCMHGKFQILAHGFAQIMVDILCILPQEYTKLKGEACLVIARIANTNHSIHGSANEFVLREPTCIQEIVSLCSGLDFLPRVRLCGFLALAQLCKDEFQTVPLIVKNNGLNVIVNSLNELENCRSNDEEAFIKTQPKTSEEVEELLLQALRIAYDLVHYMEGEYSQKLVKLGLNLVLQRLASKNIDDDQQQKKKNENEDFEPELGVADISNSILDELRRYLGADTLNNTRQVNTAPPPRREVERPLTTDILVNTLSSVSDPFGFKAKQKAFFSPSTGEMTLLPPCSTAKGRFIDTRSNTRRKNSKKKLSTSNSEQQQQEQKQEQQQEQQRQEKNMNHTDLLWTRPPGKPKPNQKIEEMKFLLSTRPTARPSNSF